MKTVTDNQWEKWARNNPYFGVLLVETDDMANDETRQRFFASGKQHITNMLNLIENKLGPVETGKALDFGCGVGRLLGPLAARFNHVSGVDVSPTMLELAQANLRDLKNVDFWHSLDEVEATCGQFDFVHSYIVIQHIRPRQGAPIIRKLISVTKPGGVFALHFTVGDRRRFRKILNSLRYNIPPLHILYNISRRRPWNESITEMNRYDLGTVIGWIAPEIDEDMIIRYVDQNGHNSVILLGRKRSD